MKKILLIIFCALLFAGQGVNAQTDLSAKIPVTSKVKIGTLPNGLKYYIVYNAKPEKKVELRMAVNAGAILEDDDQQGLAHFLEHMNFNGLTHFPDNELVHYLQSIGVGFGNDLNAFTGFDETVYILPVPSDDADKLDKAFTVIADWAHGTLLTDKEIDKERGVILSESRLGKGADDRMMKIWLPKMLNGSKYGERLPIGIDSIIANFDYKVLRRFYTDWYRPDNQAVIVVGDMPVEKAEQMIKEKFGDVKNPTPERNRPETFEVKAFAQNQAMVITDKEADATYVNLLGNSHVKKPSVTEGDYLNDIINNLCFEMVNSRLDELKSSPNPPFIYAYVYLGGWARGYENFTTAAMCGPDGIKLAIQTLVTESLRVKKFGFTEAELARAKAKVLSDYEKQYNERDKTESGRLVWEYVNNFLSQEPIPGIEWEYNFAKTHMDKITLKNFDDIRNKIDIGDKYFSYVTTKTAAGLPSDAQYKQWIDEAMKSNITAYAEKQIASKMLTKEPVAGKIVKTVKNEKLGTTTFTLSNGAIVCIKPTDFKNDEILLKGSKFGGYSAYTGADYQSAQFSNNVVEEMGYGSFSTTDLDKFLSGKNVKISPVVDTYTEYINGNSTIKDLETMFQLLYLKCTEPRIDKEAFQSFVTRSKQQLELTKQNPENLFSDTVYNILYQGNPRAHQIESPTDYDKINLDRAVAFYLDRIGNPSGMYYTIVGTFTEAQITPLIEKYIGGLTAKASKAEYKDMGMNTIKGKQSYTLRKGSEQKAMLTHYFTGASTYNPDDNFLLSQLNGVLNNKITDTIREKMSAIYGGGFYGSVSKYPKEELTLQSYFPCSPDNIKKVDSAFLKLVDGVKMAGGITEKDWQGVREPGIQSYKVNIKKNSYWLNNLQSFYLNGVDPERILTVEQRLQAITPEKLIETAKKFYSTPNIFTGMWLPENKK
jgi:zinc protease